MPEYTSTERELDNIFREQLKSRRLAITNG